RPRPMTAMVVGVNGVARGVERGGETSIAPAVLGEAVGDLHDRPRPSLGQPAAREQAVPVVGEKRECAPRHSPLSMLRIAKRAVSHKNLARSASAVKGASGSSWPPGSPNFLLAESDAIGYGSSPMARYLFITGGVVSSLGKGLASAALGALLQARGYTVR